MTAMPQAMRVTTANPTTSRGSPGRDEVVEVELHHDGETWRQLQLHEVEELLEGLDVGGHELTKNNYGLNAFGSIKSRFKLREMLTRAASNGDEITREDFYNIMTKRAF